LLDHKKRAQQNKTAQSALILPVWDQADPMSPLLSVVFGRYPAPTSRGILLFPATAGLWGPSRTPPDKDVPDYKAVIRREFEVPERVIPIDGEIPKVLLDSIPPLLLTTYDMRRTRDPTGWLNPGIVLGSASDFDDLVLFWNLRAAGAMNAKIAVLYQNDDFGKDYLNGLRKGLGLARERSRRAVDRGNTQVCGSGNSQSLRYRVAPRLCRHPSLILQTSSRSRRNLTRRSGNESVVSIDSPIDMPNVRPVASSLAEH
jgi:hypothetical protein